MTDTQAPERIWISDLPYDLDPRDGLVAMGFAWNKKHGANPVEYAPVAALEALEAENKRLREALEDAASAVEWGARRIESPSQRLLMEKWANEYRKALEGE